MARSIKKNHSKGFGTMAETNRITFASYGENDTIHHIVAVLHGSQSGKVKRVKMWDGSEDFETVSNELIDFAKSEDAQIFTLDEMLPPESCPHCGSKTYRVTTDEDLRRAGKL